MSSTYLAHYGVKGMKWGKHKQILDKTRDTLIDLRNERMAEEALADQEQSGDGSDREHGDNAFTAARYKVNDRIRDNAEIIRERGVGTGRMSKPKYLYSTTKDHIRVQRAMRQNAALEKMANVLRKADHDKYRSDMTRKYLRKSFGNGGVAQYLGRRRNPSLNVKIGAQTLAYKTQEGKRKNDEAWWNKKKSKPSVSSEYLAERESNSRKNKWNGNK